MGRGFAALALAATAAVAWTGPAGAQSAAPPGISANKVLVIGTDGTNWDALTKLMAEGRAPAFARLAREGFATPTLLAYTPPAAFTVSQVGWASIATGVWPAKHGVTDFSNESPGQATKNGYPDFLTRVEAARPQLSTMLVSDWGNIGTTAHGGPLFNTADFKRVVDGGDYDAQDEAGTAAAVAQLRGPGPDASFVYLGLVDVVGHEHSPASQDYVDAIVKTDRRVGLLLDAIDARPSRARETWTVLVTTDHGQIDLLGTGFHGGPTVTERTSFVFASGPGVPPRAGPDDARVVDIAPTVLHQLGLPLTAPQDLDGRSIVQTPPPQPPGAPAARCRRTATTVRCSVRSGERAPLLRRVRGGVSGRSRTVHAGGEGSLTLSVVVKVSRRSRATRIALQCTDISGYRTRLRARIVSAR